ncbi:MlaC/ttg2D family ABC transporter substrate-binding protein [Pseudemcibacter aquimaris]|uniref:MlaC/ttg2D family ABC transporter substrate-binding protein n=1 Tax=Pseudemcibacter aquimaris TaxID=2857064 RepID=UPI0020133350|nr:ABC transporter substrate-binding protein [Pseudemcibacter aquimaris]MCC3860787.1 ABC transporter substrate-binding protein [Pseudemcibacter aquimaris]WDU59607.1 ABC transporter substrate-binding protein [Pseudemcibacter aquimaris]
MNKQVRNKAIAKARVRDTQAEFVKKMIIGLFSTLIIAAIFIFGGNAHADNKDPAEQEKARQFIEAFSERAIGVLNNKELTDAETLAEYRSILNESFALPYIARLSLSRHRKKATEEELAEYNKLFPEFILKVNSTRLKKLDTTKLEIDKVTPHAKADIFIRTKAFNSENKSIDVDWRVRSDKNGNVKIIDVKIEGISLVATQRDDFTSRITSSGISGLNQYMRDIIDGTTFAEETAS